MNGISYGMLLFILAAGVTLIFGLMRILNLAQGSLFLLGAYVGLIICRYTDNFLLAAIAGALSIGTLGMLMYWGLLRYSREHLPQILLTMGLLFIIGDAALWLWGGYPYVIRKPGGFEGVVPVGNFTFPTYRLLLIVIAVILAVFLWWFQEKTKYGAIIRAGVDDEEMTQGIGINTPIVEILVFGLGSGLAGLGGVICGPLIGIYPGVDLEVLTMALVVVIIGGFGSLVGAFVGALIVGLADNLGKVFLPEFSPFLIFGIIALVLVIKPTGLFGRV